MMFIRTFCQQVIFMHNSCGQMERKWTVYWYWQAPQGEAYYLYNYWAFSTTVLFLMSVSRLFSSDQIGVYYYIYIQTKYLHSFIGNLCTFAKFLGSLYTLEKFLKVVANYILAVSFCNLVTCTHYPCKNFVVECKL